MKKFLRLGFYSAMTFLASATAFAQTAGGGDNNYKGLIALGAGLALGIGAFGGGLGQGKAAASALDGIARNPSAYNRIFTPLIISLALIESLVIYCLVVAFILQGKI